MITLPQRENLKLFQSLSRGIYLYRLPENDSSMLAKQKVITWSVTCDIWTCGGGHSGVACPCPTACTSLQRLKMLPDLHRLQLQARRLWLPLHEGHMGGGIKQENVVTPGQGLAFE